MAAKKDKIHAATNRNDLPVRARHPTNDQEERTHRTRHSRYDAQTRWPRLSNLATSMAANAHAKHNDPFVTMRANRLGVKASGRTWCAKYTVQKGERRHFRRQMTETLMSGQFDRVVFELCCEEDSVLSMNVVGRRLTGRDTEALNLDDSRASRANAGACQRWSCP